MAVKIKLKRLGKIRAPYYRIIVADARTKRDGRAIEEIGKYHPKSEPSLIEVDSDRAQHWLGVGAQPTDPVRKILEVTGDWQKFKGLPGAEGTLKPQAPRENRKDIFAEALKETLGDALAPPKGKGRDKDSAPARSGGRTARGKGGDGEKAGTKDGAASAKDGASGAKDGASGAKDGASGAKDGASGAKDGAAGSGTADDAAGKTAPAETAAATDSPAADGGQAAGGE